MSPLLLYHYYHDGYRCGTAVRVPTNNIYIGTYHVRVRVLEAVTSPINRKPYANATAHAHAHTRVCSQTVF